MANPFALDISPLHFSVDDDLLDLQFGVPNISMFGNDISSLDSVDTQSLINLPVPGSVPLNDHDQQEPLVFQYLADDVLFDDGNEFGVWDNIGESNNNIIQQETPPPQQQPLFLSKSKRQREDGSNNNKLTKEDVSQYFYMPITEAAKELKMGLTLLKKCCRELGIGRWPHRKLVSLKTLMKNVEEGMSEISEEKKREWIGRLEEERRLIEEMPDLQMHHNTKRLRQSCFKQNYKKRRSRISNNLEMEMEMDTTVNQQLAQDEEDLQCLLYSYSLSPISDIMASL